MRILVRSLVVVFIMMAGMCTLSSPLLAKEVKSEASKQLHQLFDDDWQRELRNNPITASYYGESTYDDQLPDVSLKAIDARHQADIAMLKRLKKIDQSTLNETDKLSFATKQWQLERAIKRHRFKEYLMPINQRGGIQTFDNNAESLRFNTAQDYRNWLKRLKQFGGYMDQTIALMKEGAKLGITPPRATMQRIPGQIKAQLTGKPEKSRFYQPFADMPTGISASEKAAIQKEAKQTIASVVLPAFQKLDTYFNNEYLPKTRETIAVRDLPNGEDFYTFLAEYFTTTNLTPNQIHDIGLKEVARIKSEMLALKDEVGFKGDLQAFFNHLRTDPQFFYKEPQELLAAYRAISKRMDPALLKAFNRVPSLPYGVRPIPDNVAPDTTTAYYMPGSAKAARPGWYYVNLYQPETRPKWEMMALSLHEAVPGHHFQFSYAQELPALPKFRAHSYFVAYGEGWGLYAERLGYDMGMYDDPYDRFGQLTYDMWRAVRLVVDTGMHHKGWSRQQAIDYFKANAPKTEADIINEIDRYLIMPGQALGYKIGQLKISELRERASKKLGSKFNLKDFHDVVLGAGSVPLSVLEKRVDEWIAEVKKA